MTAATYPMPRRWRVIAALGGLITRFRRAMWRQRVEEILQHDYGWSFDDAVCHADLLEDVAESLIASRVLNRWPTPNEAIGISASSRAF